MTERGPLFFIVSTLIFVVTALANPLTVELRVCNNSGTTSASSASNSIGTGAHCTARCDSTYLQEDASQCQPLSSTAGLGLLEKYADWKIPGATEFAAKVRCGVPGAKQDTQTCATIAQFPSTTRDCLTSEEVVRTSKLRCGSCVRNPLVSATETAQHYLAVSCKSQQVEPKQMNSGPPPQQQWIVNIMRCDSDDCTNSCDPWSTVTLTAGTCWYNSSSSDDTTMTSVPTAVLPWFDAGSVGLLMDVAPCTVNTLEVYTSKDCAPSGTIALTRRFPDSECSEAGVMLTCPRAAASPTTTVNASQPSPPPMSSSPQPSILPRVPEVLVWGCGRDRMTGTVPADTCGVTVGNLTNDERMRNVINNLPGTRPVLSMSCGSADGSAERGQGYEGDCVHYEYYGSQASCETRDAKEMVPMDHVCGKSNQFVFVSGTRWYVSDVTCNITDQSARLIIRDPITARGNKSIPEHTPVYIPLSQPCVLHWTGYWFRLVRIYPCRYAIATVYNGTENCTQRSSDALLMQRYMPLHMCDSEHGDVAVGCKLSGGRDTYTSMAPGGGNNGGGDTPNPRSANHNEATDFVEVIKCDDGCLAPLAEFLNTSESDTHQERFCRIHHHDKPIPGHPNLVNHSGDDVHATSVRFNSGTCVKSSMATPRVGAAALLSCPTFQYVSPDEGTMIKRIPQSYDFLMTSQIDTCRVLQTATASTIPALLSDAQTIAVSSIVCGKCNFRHGEWYELMCPTETNNGKYVTLKSGCTDASCVECARAVDYTWESASSSGQQLYSNRQAMCLPVDGLGGRLYVLRVNERLSSEMPVRIAEFSVPEGAWDAASTEKSTYLDTQQLCLLSTEGGVADVLLADYWVPSGTCINGETILSCIGDQISHNSATVSPTGGVQWETARSVGLWVALFFVAMVGLVLLLMCITRLRYKLHQQRNANYVSMYEMTPSRAEDLE